MRILRSYILRLHLVPFLLGFGVVTFILEMDALVEYLDLAVNRGIAAWVVAQRKRRERELANPKAKKRKKLGNHLKLIIDNDTRKGGAPDLDGGGKGGKGGSEDRGKTWH